MERSEEGRQLHFLSIDDPVRTLHTRLHSSSHVHSRRRPPHPPLRLQSTSPPTPQITTADHSRSKPTKGAHLPELLLLSNNEPPPFHRIVHQPQPQSPLSLHITTISCRPTVPPRETCHPSINPH